MITKEKIKLFYFYNGEIDAFGHGSKKDREILTDYEFLFIARLVQDYKLVLKNLTSNEFKLNLEKEITKNCDTIETIEYLKSIS